MYKRISFFLLAAILVCVTAEKAAAETVYDSFPQKDFTAAISTGIPNLHPHTAYDADEAQILTALYEGLCVYDSYTVQPVPGLAERWEVSSDGLRWTFIIRQGLTFENGDAITAQTFKKAFLNLLNPALKLPYASLLDCIKGAKNYRMGTLDNPDSIGIIAESDTELQLMLEYPAKHLPNILCHHAFAAVHDSQLEAAAQYAEGTAEHADDAFRPIASGPFKIQTFTDGELKLVKNPVYWDEKRVSLPSITLMLQMTPDAAAEGFNNGTVHWTGTGAYLAGIAASHTIHVSPMFATEYLYFKTDVPPCTNTVFRKALLAALPYEELRQDYLIPASTLVIPFAGYPSRNGIAKQDEKRAKKLLKESKEEQTPVPLKLLFPDTAHHRKQAGVLKTAWETLGLSVEVELCPLNDYQDKLKTNLYHVATMSWIGDFADPLTFLELFRTHSHLNAAAWTDSQYENLLKKAARDPDYQNRLRHLAQAEQTLLDAAVIIPLSHIPAINVIDLNEVKGWHINALNIHPFKFIRFSQPDPFPGIALK